MNVRLKSILDRYSKEMARNIKTFFRINVDKYKSLSSLIMFSVFKITEEKRISLSTDSTVMCGEVCLSK